MSNLETAICYDIYVQKGRHVFFMKVKDRLIQSFTVMHRDVYETKKDIADLNRIFFKYKSVLSDEDQRKISALIFRTEDDNNKVIAEFETLMADLKIMD